MEIMEYVTLLKTIFTMIEKYHYRIIILFLLYFFALMCMAKNPKPIQVKKRISL